MSLTIYDLIIAAALIFMVWHGYKRGFVLTLCGFLAIFVAFVGALLISYTLAEPLAGFIQPAVENSLHAYLVKAAPDVSAISELDLPAVLSFLEDSTLYRGFVDALKEAITSQAAAAAGTVISAVAGHIAAQVAQTLLFLLAFGAVLLAWTIASRVLDLAFRLPVLSTLNDWAGAAAGLVKGCTVFFIAAWLLKGRFLPPEAIQTSPLLHFFCTTNPLDFIR